MNIKQSDLKVTLSLSPENGKGFLLTLTGFIGNLNEDKTIPSKTVLKDGDTIGLYFEERKYLERYLLNLRSHLFYTLSPQDYDRIEFNAESPCLRAFLILLDRVFITDSEFLLLVFIDIILSTNLSWVLYSKDSPYSGMSMVETLLSNISKLNSLDSNVETVIANHPQEYCFMKGYRYLTEMGTNVVNVLNITECSSSFSNKVRDIIVKRTVSDEEETCVFFLPFPVPSSVNDTPENGVFDPTLLKNVPDECFLEELLESIRSNFYLFDNEPIQDSSLILRYSFSDFIQEAYIQQGFEVTPENCKTTAVLSEHLLASHAWGLINQNEIYFKKVDNLSEEEMLRILPVILQAGDGNCYVIVTSYNTL